MLLKRLTKKTLKNFMAPFYGWGSTASRLEPLQNPFHNKKKILKYFRCFIQLFGCKAFLN